MSTSLCCPSRATFLTGHYSHNHGVMTNRLPDGGVTMLDDGQTLAVWLHDAGYTTSFVGKYLNGYGRDVPAFVPPGWDDWQGLIDPNQVYNYDILDNGQVVRSIARYQTDELARRAADFITHANDPLFLWITPLAPHIEARQLKCPNRFGRTIRPAPRHIGTLAHLALPQPPSFNEADLSDKPSWVEQTRPVMSADEIACLALQYQDRLESVRAVDDLVGAVVEALGPQIANTALIFTSDNGWYSGEHRDNFKILPYEEGARVPLVIRLPQGGPAAVDGLVLSNDLAPTIADLAGATPGHRIDGRSLLPLMADPTIAWRKQILIEYLGDGALGVPSFSAIRTGPAAVVPNALYVRWPTEGAEELYHLDDDPYQLESAHDDPAFASQINLFRSAVLGLSRCAGVRCARLEDAP